MSFGLKKVRYLGNVISKDEIRSGVPLSLLREGGSCISGLGELLREVCKGLCMTIGVTSANLHSKQALTQAPILAYSDY